MCNVIERIEAWLYRLSKSKSRRNLYYWIANAATTHDLARAGSVLNIGAGGEIAELLQSLGIRNVSIDINPDRGPDRVASVEDMNCFSDSSFNVVFCIDVLEHVKAPATAISEIRRVLGPGGILIGSTPFLLGIHDAPADFWRFTRHGLAILFADMETLVLRERNGYFASIAVLLTRRFVIGTPRQRRMAVVFSPLILSFASAIEFFDRILPGSEATTGYFFVMRNQK
jgi:SAM-dependent methyltransferase